jgi:hypothetical protein
MQPDDHPFSDGARSARGIPRALPVWRCRHRIESAFGADLPLDMSLAMDLNEILAQMADAETLDEAVISISNQYVSSLPRRDRDRSEG